MSYSLGLFRWRCLLGFQHTRPIYANQTDRQPPRNQKTMIKAQPGRPVHPTTETRHYSECASGELLLAARRDEAACYQAWSPSVYQEKICKSVLMEDLQWKLEPRRAGGWHASSHWSGSTCSAEQLEEELQIYHQASFEESTTGCCMIPNAYIHSAMEL